MQTREREAELQNHGALPRLARASLSPPTAEARAWVTAHLPTHLPHGRRAGRLLRREGDRTKFTRGVRGRPVGAWDRKGSPGGRQTPFERHKPQERITINGNC